MTSVYFDTSAAAKLLVAEPESAALAAWLDAADSEPVATQLVETELRRLAHRLDLSQTSVTEILDRVTLFEVPPSLFRNAGTIGPANLRTLDALHLAGAIRLGVRAIITYDDRLAAAAAVFGLPVVAPAA